MSNAGREDLLRKGYLKVCDELFFNALLLRTNHKSGETWVFNTTATTTTNNNDNNNDSTYNNDNTCAPTHMHACSRGRNRRAHARKTHAGILTRTPRTRTPRAHTHCEHILCINRYPMYVSV